MFRGQAKEVASFTLGFLAKAGGLIKSCEKKMEAVVCHGHGHGTATVNFESAHTQAAGLSPCGASVIASDSVGTYIRIWLL